MYGTNVSLWSLANEFWYYIAFPCCVLCVTSKSGWKMRCLYGAAAVATLVFCGKHIVMLFPLWIFGAVVAYIPRKLSSSQSRKLSLPAALIMFFCMFAVRILNMQTLLAEYIVGVVASMVLWVVVQQTAPSGGRYYRGIANFFSNISYSLYLFHLPIAVFLCAVIDSPWHQFDRTPKNIAIFVGSDCVILFCVYVLWKLFESRTDNVRRAVFEREQSL
jgi:peptidoglycan/LPS O-acetylase OafA/YrhL